MEKAMGIRIRGMEAPIEEAEDMEVMALVKQNRKVSCDDLVLIRENGGSLTLAPKEEVRLLTEEEAMAEAKKKKEDAAIRCAAGLGLLMITAGAAGLILRTGNPGACLAMIETALVSYVGFGLKGVMG